MFTVDIKQHNNNKTSVKNIGSSKFELFSLQKPVNDVDLQWLLNYIFVLFILHSVDIQLQTATCCSNILLMHTVLVN